MKVFFYLLLPLTLFHLRSYGQDLTQEMVNSVSEDSVMTTIRKLESFGTRYEYAPQQDSAGAYLLREFLRLGFQAEADPYRFGIITLYDMASSGNGTLFTCGSGGVMLSSADGGDHWASITMPSYITLYGIAFADGQTGCAVGASGEIQRTSNGGNSWTSITSGVTESLYDVGFANCSLGIAAGSGGAILRTTDGGLHWTPVPSGTSASLRAVKIVQSGENWVGGDAGTLLRSTDAGLTWIPVPTGLYTALYAIEFSSPSHGWAVGDGPAVISTTNGGATWNQVPSPPMATQPLRAICFRDSLHGWMVEFYGKIFNTSDGGNSWSLAYDHFSGDWGPFFFGIKPMTGQKVLAYGNQGLLLRGADNGQSWESLTANLPSSFIHATQNIVATLPGSVTPDRECVLVAHYDSYCANAAPRVSAPGANDNGSGTGALLEAARIAKGYRFRSTLKFVAVSGEELGMYGSNHYAREAMEQQRQIVGVVNGDMIGHPTTPDTARLVIATYLTPGRLTDSAFAANQRYGLGITLAAGLDSTGASDYGPFAIRGYDALDIAEGTAYEIWGGNDPYYHSTSDISTNIHPGLIRLGAQLMLAVAANLAGPLSVDAVEEQEPEMPESFALEQNYPNPFNPTTTIKFTVGAASGQWKVAGEAGAGIQEPGARKTRLVVYDVLGREVATLVDEEKAAGSYEVTFNASGLASGVYVCRMTAGLFTQSRKMILMK